jgi:hypothetical protein
MQRFAVKFASLLWFFIGYWILKARLDFYPASFFCLDSQKGKLTVNNSTSPKLERMADGRPHDAFLRHPPSIICHPFQPVFLNISNQDTIRNRNSGLRTRIHLFLRLNLFFNG